MNKFWKMFFWFMAIIMAINFIQVPFSRPDFPELLMLVFSVFSLFPVYGYAYQVAIGSKGIAILIFMLNMPFFLYGVWLSFRYYMLDASFAQVIFTSIGLIFIVLLIYPLYAYAFKSKHIWGYEIK